MAQKQRIRPRQERAVAMRRTLLDSTLRLLDRHGVERLSTTAIVREAHVASGTFYRYFNDKDEIVAVLRTEAVAAINADLVDAVVDALDVDAAEGVRRVVETLVTAFEQHRAIMLAVINQQTAGQNANVLPEVEADLQRLATILPRRHLPDASPARVEAVVFMMMGVMVSTCLRIALQRPPSLDRDELVAMAATMLVAGFEAPR